MSIDFKNRAAEADVPANSTLVFRNVTVGSKRTSLRLEQTIWDAVAEICQRENLSLGELCGRLNERRREATLTAALRVYVLCYYKVAATEEGHASAGHGSLGGAPKRRPPGPREGQR